VFSLNTPDVTVEYGYYLKYDTVSTVLPIRAKIYNDYQSGPDTGLKSSME
jgi:hypothetical protein